MEKVLALIGTFALAVVSGFYSYFVFTKIWGYIAVSMFHAPQITIWQAFGLSLILSFFNIVDLNKSETSLAPKILGSMLGKSITWGIAYAFFG